MKLGATKFIASKERDQMKAAASSIDFLLSCAAFDLDWDGLLGLLAPKGVLHLVGAPGIVYIQTKTIFIFFNLW